MASGTNTTADTLAARFQYPATPKGKAGPKAPGKAKGAKGPAGKRAKNK